jgi:hypothetical protein
MPRLCRGLLQEGCSGECGASRVPSIRIRLWFQCDKRHQFLCPDFEKTKKCAKRRCPYPHGNTVRKNTKVLNTLAKKCSTKKDKVRKRVARVLEPENGRYYKDSHVESSESGQEPVLKAVSRDRPKLGDLPAFIPFFETT